MNSKRMMFWCVGACLLSLVTVAALAQPAPQASQFTLGAYHVTVAGHFNGKGTAAVGAGTVTITVPVRQEDGQSGTLVVANLPLSNGRFKGEGAVGGRSVTISGRIEPGDGKIVKKSRLSATFLTAENRGGRISGYRTGN